MKHLKLFGFLLAASLAFGLVGCGSDDEVNEVDDGSDVTDVTDQSDPADTSDASDPTDPTDTSDSSDVSDPSEPVASGSCADYPECEGACFEASDDAWDSCIEDCRAGTSPEALTLVDAYNSCVDNCADTVDVNDEDAFIACLDESCGEQYNRCIAPDGCISVRQLR